MSGQIINMVAKRVLKDTAKKNINSKDPYYEEVAVYGRDGRPTGQFKKQKKGIPAILSQHDGSVLKKVRRRAYRLDMSLFNCCGIRFGWSSVIGFVPVIGDVIDLYFAWMVVRACSQIEGGLPTAILSRMYFNVMLDFGLGLVPFLGDIADAVFRANTRNAWILEEYLIQRAHEQQKLGVEGPGSGRPAVPPKNDKPSMGPGAQKPLQGGSGSQAHYDQAAGSAQQYGRK